MQNYFNYLTCDPENCILTETIPYSNSNMAYYHQLPHAFSFNPVGLYPVNSHLVFPESRKRKRDRDARDFSIRGLLGLSEDSPADSPSSDNAPSQYLTGQPDNIRTSNYSLAEVDDLLNPPKRPSLRRADSSSSDNASSQYLTQQLDNIQTSNCRTEVAGIIDYLNPPMRPSLRSADSCSSDNASRQYFNQELNNIQRTNYSFPEVPRIIDFLNSPKALHHSSPAQDTISRYGGPVSLISPETLVSSTYDAYAPSESDNPSPPACSVHSSYSDDASSPAKKSKRSRTIFTPLQLEKLEQEFEKTQYMVGAARVELAMELKLTESQVKVWFQNRRIKERKQTFDSQKATLSKLNEDEELSSRSS